MKRHINPAVRAFLFAVIVLALSGCSGKQNQTVTEKQTTSQASSAAPTGYASEQVQRIFVFYEGKLYVRKDEPQIPYNSSMKVVAEIQSVNNDEYPKTELAATHLSVGDKLLIAGDRIFVQQKGAESVDELEIYPDELQP